MQNSTELVNRSGFVGDLDREYYSSSARSRSVLAAATVLGLSKFWDLLRHGWGWIFVVAYFGACGFFWASYFYLTVKLGEPWRALEFMSGWVIPWWSPTTDPVLNFLIDAVLVVGGLLLTVGVLYTGFWILVFVVIAGFGFYLIAFLLSLWPQSPLVAVLFWGAALALVISMLKRYGNAILEFFMRILVIPQLITQVKQQREAMMLKDDEFHSRLRSFQRDHADFEFPPVPVSRERQRGYLAEIREIIILKAQAKTEEQRRKVMTEYNNLCEQFVRYQGLVLQGMDNQEELKRFDARQELKDLELEAEVIVARQKVERLKNPPKPRANLGELWEKECNKRMDHDIRAFSRNQNVSNLDPSKMTLPQREEYQRILNTWNAKIRQGPPKDWSPEE